RSADVLARTRLDLVDAVLVAGPHRLERPDHHPEGVAAATRHQGLVEPTADLVEGHVVVDDLPLLVDDGPEHRHHRLVAVGAAGAEGGADRLDVADGSADVGQGGVPGLEDEADHVGDPLGARRPDDGPADVAAADPDEAFGLQYPERLPDGRRAHPERVEEVLLPGERVTLGQVPGEDVVAQRRRHQLGQAWLPQLLSPSRPKAVRHRSDCNLLWDCRAWCGRWPWPGSWS